MTLVTVQHLVFKIWITLSLAHVRGVLIMERYNVQEM